MPAFEKRLNKNILNELERMSTFEPECNEDHLSGFMHGVKWVFKYLEGPNFNCAMYDFGNDPCRDQCEKCKNLT